MTAALKCVIWDLDNTLWNGTLAEGDRITLVPEAHALARRLEDSGVVQSLASKNDYDDAMRALRAVGLEHLFVYPQVSWSAKSIAVSRIVASLGVAADSVVMLDDSPFERAEIAAAVSELRCMSLESFLADDSTQQLVPRAVTSDGRRRPEAYREESRRREAETQFVGAPAEFLHTLGLVLTIRPATSTDLVRAAELTERTHQLNTTGRVFSAAELERYVHDPDQSVLIAELTDRFGDYGRIGLCLLRHEADHWLIELLLMSCRVLGRNIGNAMIAAVAAGADEAGVRLRALFRPNDRNRQMRITYGFLGFEATTEPDGTVLFEHAEPAQIVMPAYVRLHEPGADGENAGSLQQASEGD